MNGEEITRQATSLVRNIHPIEETSLLSSETKDGTMFSRYRKKFCLDGIELVQEFGVAITTQGKFVYLVTKSQAQIEAVPAGVLDSLTALLAGIQAGLTKVEAEKSTSVPPSTLQGAQLSSPPNVAAPLGGESHE